MKRLMKKTVLTVMATMMVVFAACGKKEVPEEKLDNELESVMEDLEEMVKDEEFYEGMNQVLEEVAEEQKDYEVEQETVPEVFYMYTFEDGVLTINLDLAYSQFNREIKNFDEVTEIVIGDEVTVVPRSRFQNYKNLKRITIGENVQVIEDHAFAGCSNLETVILSKNLRKIGDSAFWSCESLKSIEFPESLTWIGEGAFKKCTSLEEINLPKNVSIDQEAFQSCFSVTELVFEEGVRGINSSVVGAAFGELAITELTVPGTIENIGDRAFCHNANLETVVINDGVKMIGKGVFVNCPMLTSVTIPSSVEFIYENPFSGCSEELTIYGAAGSAAENCAITYGIRFVAQ